MNFFNTLSNGFGRVHQLEHSDPTLTAENWVTRQPVWRASWRSKTVIITQPSSTFWVYALGIQACVLGAWFWQTADGDTARVWWSFGLWLWGIGALLAGTSYQAFGYHLKCKDGRVRWTNWYEVVYVICQQWSVNALFVATAFTSAEGVLQTVMIGISLVVTILYGVVTLVAAFIPNRKLLSFEWMCGVCAPLIAFMVLLHGWNLVFGSSSVLEGQLLSIWLALLLCMFAYWVYMKAGLTESLWQRGHWFSENDVLHLTLILWFVQIAWLIG